MPQDINSEEGSEDDKKPRAKRPRLDNAEEQPSAAAQPKNETWKSGNKKPNKWLLRKVLMPSNG